ncbi:MAG: DNA topoisomerase III [Candidatus Dactylopiibacterium carminicum]|uniref:DNA topoisomerase n=1 Tax=Candidatus Dactylopiibacterium carminicum TaxID=857335 RepID=A0A272EYW4_9RHOO|nr:DNA topoisomerase III [Candidatus Dactylopiibacterium carminicum]KAF7600802.1 DNA topoisomerase III [Candidatus Dactylopiibacterium carminicum]PAS95301.1 MAG: DNA topoisomerase III [Candidatus Dactylopiibacterium carminicum]PAS98687.1 MAG: DNA topoisomerase III [Candidatus Dactylopiibacterium carminicum]PAT00809.1 MAG: DNA topoisomerase III [Candidatus Dactylopiibacterium carminicum]
MSKQLIIAEKPSVAQDIARALGGFTRQGDYFESDDYVLSSAVGHLLELAVPDEFEVKRGKWSFAHLPTIPPHFKLNPIEKSAERLRLLTRLIKRKDVTGLINACDAGREGELIFTYVAQHAGTSKPIQRLWLQSMTPQAIRDGFLRLRSANDMSGLREAAMCRAESDWLIGINGTRAMTAFNSKSGGFHLTTVGRVQTPTLALVVEREERIRKFKSRDYWEVEARFGVSAGEYAGRWFDEAFRKPEDDEHAAAPRIWDKARAEAILAKCAGKPGKVEEESKPSTQLSPLLFDLTSLQREANGRFGFSARTTLQLAQALYEKHKVLTYPRTDSRALPEDYLLTVSGILGALPDEYAGFSAQILKRGWVKPNKRIFNNAKISDHFAIVPTGTVPKSLSEAEYKIYDLVTRRFLAVFFPVAEYQVTTRITRVEGEAFKTEGKVLINAGWLTIYGKEAALEGSEGEAAGSLVPVQAGEGAQTEELILKALQTKPPARFNEATLLSAMEGAGKLVDDEELRAAMAGRGLGTPATRAQIIENLIAETYMLREGRELIPTAKAFSLITLLKGLGISELSSAELTGEWEYKLAQMEKGELSRAEFMKHIEAMTREIVERAKTYDSDTIPGDFGILQAPCPKCGGLIRETYKKFQCSDCDYSLWKIVAGRQFEPHEIETLLTTGRVGPLIGFRNKMGRAFNAEIRLNDDKLPEFDFGQPREGEAAEAPDFSGQQSLGACPKCGNGVFDHGSTYVCEKAVGPEKSCDFRSGKVILQQAIESEQMQKLLASGKTDLLRGFVASRTHRKFSAMLVWDAKAGKVGFEFEPRAPKAPKAAAAKTADGDAQEAAPAKRSRARKVEA